MRLVLLLAVFLVIASPAAAAPAVVATTAHGDSLLAADSGPDVLGQDQLTMTLRGPGSDASEFGDTPLWPDESVLVERPQYDLDNESVLLMTGGAVSAEVATVELRHGTQTLRMDTVAGPAYAGRHAGEVRFFAGEIALSFDEYAADRAARLFDAAGALLYQSGVDEGERSVPVLRRGALRIGATLHSYDNSLPLDPTHQSAQLCMTARAGATDNLDAGCQDEPAGPEPLRLGGVRGCAAQPTTLAGFVPAATARVQALLGSGRRVAYASRATPFGRPERIVAAILPRREAIRSVTALDAAGHVLARGRVGVAPPDRTCERDARNWNFLAEAPPTHYGVPADAQVAAGDGTTRLLVREAGDLVCAGLDGLADDSTDCGTPRLDSRFTDLLRRRLPDGRTAVGGVFAARVTGVRLTLPDHSQVTIPATPSATYSGRFHDALHFAFAVVGQPPVRSELLDTAGRRIGGESRPLHVPGAPPPAHGAPPRGLSPRRAHQRERRVHRARPADGVRRVHGRGSRRRDRVVRAAPDGRLRRRAPPRPPRRALQLGGRRHLDAPLRAFAGNRIFLAVLPPRTSVTGIRFVGAQNALHETTVTTPLYSARRQCGYSFRDSL